MKGVGGLVLTSKPLLKLRYTSSSSRAIMIGKCPHIASLQQHNRRHGLDILSDVGIASADSKHPHYKRMVLEYVLRMLKTLARPSQMAARGPNLARRPYLLGPLSTPIYIEIHKKMVIIWPQDIDL